MQKIQSEEGDERVFMESVQYSCMQVSGPFVCANECSEEPNLAIILTLVSWWKKLETYQDCTIVSDNFHYTSPICERFRVGYTPTASMVFSTMFGWRLYSELVNTYGVLDNPGTTDATY